VLLWNCSPNKRNFTLVLNAYDDNRHEGDLSLVLYVDKIRLCRISFCYLNANIFVMPLAYDTPDRTKSDRVYPRAWLDDLFSMVVRPTPAFTGGKLLIFRERVREKRWLERWPRLIVLDAS
jgi:Nucleotidyltransferase